MITLVELFAAVRSADRAEQFLQPLNAAFGRFEIDTPPRMGEFLAQAIHESGSFTRFRENLNYSADGLLTTFPRYFTPEQAKEYARQPERIANRVYASRMGNGPEDSGDGWKYRGAGIFQLTGASNMRDCSQALYGDNRLVDNPELLTEPEAACMSAGWFWDKGKLNQLADQEDTKGVTRKINGGYNGLAERISLRRRIMQESFGG